MDGAPVGRGHARASHVHLQDRGRFGVRLVVGVFTLDADDVAEVLAGPVAGAAHLVRRTEIGDHAGNRAREPPGHHVIQLPYAVQFVVDERASAFADVALHARDTRMGASCHAVNCGCIGVWQVWPQNVGDSM